MRVLWLTPNKLENISVGRSRIASQLESLGFEITMRAGRPKAFREVLQRNKYDAVIGTTRAGAIVGIPLSRALGCPLIVDHIDPIRQFKETNGWPLTMIVEQLEHLSFREAAHTFYVYTEERERVNKHAEAATQTDLGVDFGRFANPEASVLDQAGSRLEEENLREHLMIYVGGLEPIYHIRELLESVEYLDDWSLIIIGSGSLESLVTEAADSDKVLYLGTLPHEVIPGYLHTADVGVSLVDDPHTLKVLEYGAARLPTVQLVGRAEEKFAGLVEFCESEPSAIAAAVEHACEADTEMIDGLQNLAAEYSWERIADEYASVLRSVATT